MITAAELLKLDADNDGMLHRRCALMVMNKISSYAGMPLSDRAKAYAELQRLLFSDTCTKYALRQAIINGLKRYQHGDDIYALTYSSLSSSISSDSPEDKSGEIPFNNAIDNKEALIFNAHLVISTLEPMAFNNSMMVSSTRRSRLQALKALIKNPSCTLLSLQHAVRDALERTVSISTPLHALYLRLDEALINHYSSKISALFTKSNFGNAIEQSSIVNLITYLSRALQKNSHFFAKLFQNILNQESIDIDHEILANIVHAVITSDDQHDALINSVATSLKDSYIIETSNHTFSDTNMYNEDHASDHYDFVNIALKYDKPRLLRAIVLDPAFSPSFEIQIEYGHLFADSRAPRFIGFPGSTILTSALLYLAMHKKTIMKTRDDNYCMLFSKSGQSIAQETAWRNCVKALLNKFEQNHPLLNQLCFIFPEGHTPRELALMFLDHKLSNDIKAKGGDFAPKERKAYTALSLILNDPIHPKRCDYPAETKASVRIMLDGGVDFVFNSKTLDVVKEKASSLAKICEIYGLEWDNDKDRLFAVRMITVALWLDIKPRFSEFTTQLAKANFTRLESVVKNISSEEACVNATVNILEVLAKMSILSQTDWKNTILSELKTNYACQKKMLQPMSLHELSSLFDDKAPPVLFSNNHGEKHENWIELSVLKNGQG